MLQILVQRAQAMLPGLDIVGAAGEHQGLLAVGQAETQVGDDFLHDLVLDLEDVVEAAIMALSPEVAAIGGIDQLRGVTRMRLPPVRTLPSRT